MVLIENVMYTLYSNVLINIEIDFVFFYFDYKKKMYTMSNFNGQCGQLYTLPGHCDTMPKTRRASIIKIIKQRNKHKVFDFFFFTHMSIV